MKKTILTTTLSLLGLIAFSQSAVVSAGNEATGTGGTASYTIGEVVYIEATGTGGTSSQGASFYTAENPDYGALFTYYIPENFDNCYGCNCKIIAIWMGYNDQFEVDPK